MKTMNAKAKIGLVIAAAMFAFQSGVSVQAATFATPSTSSVTGTQTTQSTASNEQTSSVPKNAISVKHFGAKGDGTTNDTSDIQAAIDSASKNHVAVVYVPAGTYMIDATKSLEMHSNVTLQLSSDATLKAIPNNKGSYRIIRFAYVNNASVIGGNIVGERFQHKGTTGEDGMGIYVKASRDIKIANLTVKDCWGDGIYLGDTASNIDNKNITIKNVRSTGNRRNGITIITGENINVNNCTVANTQGTAPSDGLDIEPNHKTNVLKNISVNNLTSSHNVGNGFEVCTKNLNQSGQSIGITINGLHDTGSKHGLYVSKYLVSGTVNVIRSTWVGETAQPVLQEDNVAPSDSSAKVQANIIKVKFVKTASR